MYKRIILTLAVFLLVSVSSAQDPIPERLLLSTGQYTGAGSRAMGLGGTFTGIADDYSSVWWNPAGLVQIKRIELQASVNRAGFSNDASYYGISREGAASKMRLNNIGMVLPVPVYQGALSFAFGYNQLVSFDRRTRVQSSLAGEGYWDDFDELEGGRLGFWTLAGAMDVSPNLAFGIGINYWVGTDDLTRTGHYTDNADVQYYTEETVVTDLSGWNFSFGSLFRIGRYARAGLSMQTPFKMSLDEEWTYDTDNGYFDYSMTYPAVIRAGASFCPGRWLVAADIEYRDWSSLEFRSDTPFDGVTKAEANQQIKDSYESTTRLSFGGEYLFPLAGVRVRAGYSIEPSNFNGNGGDDNRSGISLGMGVLVDRSVMFDFGYQLSNYSLTSSDGGAGSVDEDVNLSSALITICYRL